jgi:membrane protein implicated in regulation of membrane protease activity
MCPAKRITAMVVAPVAVLSVTCSVLPAWCHPWLAIGSLAVSVLCAGYAAHMTRHMEARTAERARKMGRQEGLRAALEAIDAVN